MLINIYTKSADQTNKSLFFLINQLKNITLKNKLFKQNVVLGNFSYISKKIIFENTVKDSLM